MTEDQKLPDITMELLEYVRVRDGELTAQLNAEYAERYEETHLMALKNYKFEQYNTINNEIDAEGNGGAASIELVSNNIKMNEGISIKVDSEDFSLETMQLEWQDKSRTLLGGERDPVQISRGDGTKINGTDFYADARTRTWVFGANVSGVYVYEEDEDDGVGDGDSGEEKKESETVAESIETGPPVQ
jgi:LPS export ABC transporter protein LptC